MKKAVITVVLAVSLCLIGLAAAVVWQSAEDNDVQKYIKKTYTDDDHLIYAYPNNPHSQYLSESIGLYMNYLLLIDDQKTFNVLVQQLKNHFFVKKENALYISWVLKENANTNALIDDVRIIAALRKGASQFGENEYAELANKLARTIERQQTADGIYVDYVDWAYNESARRVTLSYLTPDFFYVLKKTVPSKEILTSLDEKKVFFPEYYDLTKRTYSYGAKIHMIDQLLIAINRENVHEPSRAFHKWIIEEWKAEGRIAGQYFRKTAEPAVEYESLAVYAYLEEYFRTTGDGQLAEEVHERSTQLVKNGILKEAHFFDYILYETKKTQ
ncbi:hypothetical protein [Bacillus badius]|uniref:Glycoside transferase n=2 Tax=Bacillus badius TaxID=1455 RepID=A0ABR5APD0_BACBA|nr:hypothetical protein SD77_2857 [Bacillus badius]KZN99317.1 hypothetical protein A4244_05620 [Bacillus badius]KZR59161.1 hypothetical protein A3781_14340 [Bacillus badius]OCS84798.1 hypothetical protein A6M11_05625 [Bacillus badius]OVE46488.1 hypothetical protein B1A98_19530 [Bacillus badius]